MDSVNKIAANHIEKLNQDIDAGQNSLSFRYGYGDMIEFSRCYYFDYLILKNERSNIDPPVLGGAPGFTIDKRTNILEITSHQKLSELRKNERQLEEIHIKLNNVKAGNEPLLSLKKLLHLTPSELIELKNRLDREEISDEYLDQLVQKMNNK